MPIHNPFGRRGTPRPTATYNPFSKPVVLNAPFYSPYQQRQLLPEEYERRVNPELIAPPEEETPIEEVRRKLGISPDDSGGDDNEGPESVEGGWTTEGEIRAAWESGWFGTYSDARAAKDNPKAQEFVDIVGMKIEQKKMILMD